MGNKTKAFLVLFFILFWVMVGFGIIIPILPFVVTHFGGGPTTLGLFMASFSLMQFFFAPIWGRLSDRIGRRPVLLIGLSGYGITFILLGMANHLWMLFAIRMLSGIISSATLPTAMAYIVDITEGEERSKGMGLMGAAMGVGMIFGPALGGWLGHYGFATPFYAAGALVIITWPFAYFFLPESLKKLGSHRAENATKLSFDVFNHPLFTLFMLNFITNFSMAIFQGTFALYAAEKAGFGPTEMGTLFTVMGIISVIIQGGMIGRLVRRFGDANLIKAGLFISGVGMALILVSSHMLTLMISTAVFNIGGALMGPSTTTLVSKNTLGAQGASIGLLQSFGSLGRILGPVVGGILYGIHMNIPYITGAIILLLLGIMSLQMIDKYDTARNHNKKPS